MQRCISRSFPPRHQFTHNLNRKLIRLIACAAFLGLAAAAFAAPTVTILSPTTNSHSGSPVFYEAYATSPTCATGISAMRIYSAPGVNAYTANGAHIETFLPLKAGTYSTVVQAWDNCGGVGKTALDITVNSTAGISVFLPSSTSAGMPVHIAASAQNPECSAGINAMRVYTANGTSPYTIDSDQLNAFVNLLPAADYNLTLIAWDNCGHTYKYDFVETAVANPDSYLYALNDNGVARFNISNGALTNPNGSGNPPTVYAPQVALSMAIDPGGWFAWVFTTNGIYGYQIDQSSGNLSTMPGSPFPLNGTPISEEGGFLYPQPYAIAVDPNGNFLFATYQVSNTVVSYQINRSTGAITPKSTVTGSGQMTAVTADFTGQYVYAINNETDGPNAAGAVWGYQINQNNGALTAVPGSPYTFPADTYAGGSVSSTMPSGSPGSVVLYALTQAPTQDVWGYDVNYDTGALTALPGSPFYADGAGSALADNQGKWLWAPSGFPANPPQNFFNYASIGSKGVATTFQFDEISGNFTFSDLAEDGSGKYLYTSGANWCSSGNCSTPVVSSWTIGDDGPKALSGPLTTASGENNAMSVGAAPKHGD